MPVIDNTKYDQILATIKENPRNVNFKIEFDMVVDGQVYRPNALVEINQEKNFLAHCYQSTTVFLRMTQEMFNRVVYPNRYNLSLIRKKVAIGEISDEATPSSVVEARTFVATLITPGDPNMQGQVSTDDGQLLKDYLFSIRELAIDQLRLQTAGATFRETSTLDQAIFLLSKFSKSLKLPKNEKVNGVTAHKSDVTSVPFQTIIPPDVKLIDVVDYLQVNCGGIYNQAAGLFFQDNSWYIYPLYNTTRYDKAQYPADIIVTSPTLSPGMERTFTVKDGRLFIAGTGGMRQSDPEDISYLNQGNGVRFVKATALHDGPVDVESNKAKTKINDVTASISVKDRASGVQAAPFSSTRITDNVANEVSKVAARSGQILHIPWDNSDPDLIIPGQPCRILTPDRELYGTILGVQSHTKLNQPGMTGVRFKTSSVLLVFANPRK